MPGPSPALLWDTKVGCENQRAKLLLAFCRYSQPLLGPSITNTGDVQLL